MAERSCGYGTAVYRSIWLNATANAGRSTSPACRPWLRLKQSGDHLTRGGSSMETKTIQQSTTFGAPPMDVYEMLMDSKKHAALSGEPAAISREVGGSFAAWGNHISGFNLALRPGRKIVQA